MSSQSGWGLNGEIVVNAFQVIFSYLLANSNRTFTVDGNGNVKCKTVVTQSTITAGGDITSSTSVTAPVVTGTTEVDTPTVNATTVNASVVDTTTVNTTTVNSTNDITGTLTATVGVYTRLVNASLEVDTPTLNATTVNGQVVNSTTINAATVVATGNIQSNTAFIQNTAGGPYNLEAQIQTNIASITTLNSFVKPLTWGRIVFNGTNFFIAQSGGNFTMTSSGGFSGLWQCGITYTGPTYGSQPYYNVNLSQNNEGAQPPGIVAYQRMTYVLTQPIGTPVNCDIVVSTYGSPLFASQGLSFYFTFY